MDLEQGTISRIHDLCMDFDILKSRLGSLSKKYPSGVIIPIIGKDLENPVLEGIVKGLNDCDYLRKVFIALSSTNGEDYEKAMKLARDFETPCEVVWCNGPKVNIVLEDLRKKGLDVTGLKGKGKDLWMTLGIASLELYAVAIHDSDIVSYTGALPTKLLYSVVEPRLDFFFSKGYYARLNLEKRKIYGRIYRLFLSPLFDALQEKLGHDSRFIGYLQSFRYTLSGEIAIYTDLAMNLRIPAIGVWN